MSPNPSPTTTAACEHCGSAIPTTSPCSRPSPVANSPPQAFATATCAACSTPPTSTHPQPTSENSPPASAASSASCALMASSERSPKATAIVSPPKAISSPPPCPPSAKLAAKASSVPIPLQHNLRAARGNREVVDQNAGCKTSSSLFLPSAQDRHDLIAHPGLEVLGFGVLALDNEPTLPSPMKVVACSRLGCR